MRTRCLTAVLTPLLLPVLLCTGCASFSSKGVHPEDAVEGLVYFLPKKDVLLTLTVGAGQLTGVTMATTAAYPDRSLAFELSHSSNGLAKNTTNFEIRNGLLTSTSGTLTSGVSEALKNLATTSVQTGGSRGTTGTTDTSLCGKDGNHSYRIAADAAPIDICGVHISIEKLAPPTGKPAPSGGTRLDTASSRAGIYYRQMEGLLVVAQGQGLHSASIQYVPAQPTYFLPAGRSFFSNNGTEMALEEGVPTKFKRDADSEVVALLKLPADVIAAYFTAIGGLFDAFKTRDNKEQGALQESLKLESVKQKYAVCLSAIKAGDDELISKLGCDKL